MLLTNHFKPSFFQTGYQYQQARRLTLSITNLQCPGCNGTKIMICKDCKGEGILQFGGYHTQNHVQVEKITNANNNKWTAIKRTFGWRHFQVRGKKKEGKIMYIKMQSVIDENKVFWLNVKELKDRKIWAKGWLQTDLIKEMEKGNKECKTCEGIGQLKCTKCADGYIDIDALS
eukprot:TRINITY_DN2087_c1_g1_i2.p3 TRINITY_DN2087_c1_g1~~TRINITY_DN2087_c1_g1_i2.p3  ORF type:complete len:174 (+),score=22.63 TRINITY_DN2087_c1_g1_i2:70-591(+)